MATTAVDRPFFARPTSILVLVSAAHGVTHVYSALFPLIYPIIQRDWAISYTALGVMVGATSFASGLLQLVFGFVGRALPRNVVLGLGNLGLALTTGLTGLTTGFAAFTGLRFLAAVANAPQHPVGNSLIADRYPRDGRGTALAVNFAGGNLGTLVVPLIAVALIEAVGWQGTLWLFAIPGIVVGLCLMIVLDDRGRTSSAEIRDASVVRQLLQVVRYPNVTLLMATSSIAAGGRGLGVQVTVVPLYLANQLGLPAATVGVLYTALLAGAVVGPMGAGRLSDWLGRKTVLVVTLVLAAASTVPFALALPLAVPMLAVVLFVMGVFAFTESPLIQSFLADCAPAGERDVLFGFYFAWTFAVGAVWLALIGVLIDQAGFTPAWWLMAASYLGAILCILPTRETKEPGR